jgi:hypothetical protein
MIKRSVVALDQYYMPMNEVTVRRAIKSVVTGRAHILDPKTWNRIDIWSDEFNFEMFKHLYVIVFPHTKAVADVKLKNRGVRNVLARDNFECQYDDCKNRATTVDHVQPSSRGGKTHWQNLVACCHSCNQKKGNKTPAEAGMVLKRSIRSPRFLLMEKFHEMVAQAQL